MKLPDTLQRALEQRAMARQIPLELLIVEILEAWLAQQHQPPKAERQEYDEFDSVDFILGLLNADSPED